MNTILHHFCSQFSVLQWFVPLWMILMMLIRIAVLIWILDKDVISPPRFSTIC